mgnify:CR=1 FL=1
MKGLELAEKFSVIVRPVDQAHRTALVFGVDPMEPLEHFFFDVLDIPAPRQLSFALAGVKVGRRIGGVVLVDQTKVFSVLELRVITHVDKMLVEQHGKLETDAVDVAYVDEFVGFVVVLAVFLDGQVAEKLLVQFLVVLERLFEGGYDFLRPE